MNFFEQQAHARKSTRWLVFLFFLAVIALIAMTDFLLAYAMLAFERDYLALSDIPVRVHLFIAIAVIVIVSLATIYRIGSLNSGGRQIAEEMGARLVLPNTKDADEKRLINVVEEMAIASGFPVPQVYIVNDNAMNAFAAGYTPHDAIVAVTRGTLENLNREELQGVIGHEFSHILNGDMRINLRLIGILFGILFIGLIGRKIVRFMSRDKDGIKLVPVGLGLIAIGYGGLFFGNMIKAMISRQREYLADASAVQFTRNPLGIAGALKKIGGASIFGTHFSNPQAEEYSHMYFMEGVSAPFFGLMNTHPPLDERIWRLEPSWDGRYPTLKKKSPPKPSIKNQDKKAPSTSKNMVTAAAMMEAIMTIGMPTTEHVNYARELIDEIPQALFEATREPLSAYALVLGLIMQDELLKSITEQDAVLDGVDKEVRKALRQLLVPLMNLDVKHRLPLIELAILPLKSLSENQRETFNRNMRAIIHYDGYVDVWEWALHYWISTLSLGKPDIPKAVYGDFANLKLACSVLLSALAHTSSANDADQRKAFADAELELGISLKLLPETELNSDLLIHAVDKVRNLKPLVKPKFLKALCLVAQHDGTVEAKEVELIRAISEGMGCPMPPVLDHSPVA